MKLALIGCDSEALALVEALLASSDNLQQTRFQLTAAFDLGPWESDVIRLAGAVDTRSDWESLLVASPVDAVLVACGQLDPADKTGYNGQERRCEQLRKIVQAGLPLVVIHPGCEEIVGFELEMIRSDQQGTIVPWFPGFVPGAISALCDLAHSPESPLGEIEQVTMERELQDRSRSQVLWQFSRDAEILRRLLGSITKVAASGPVSESMRDPMAGGPKPLLPLANLSVHLSGNKTFPARWSIVPSDQPVGARITLLGSKGRGVLHIPSNSDLPWKLETSLSSGQPSQSFPPVSIPEQFVASLKEANAPDHAGDWLGSCRAIEATCCIDRSLQRGRAIELFNEEHSEEGTFKGLMAAGGCLILLLTLFLFVLIVGLEILVGKKDTTLLGSWPYVILAMPLVFFMLLQLLLGLTRRNRPTLAPPSESKSAE